MFSQSECYSILKKYYAIALAVLAFYVAIHLALQAYNQNLVCSNQQKVIYQMRPGHGDNTNKQADNNDGNDDDVTNNDNEDFISGLQQDDPRLIQIIQNWFLEPLPDPATPYKFSVPNPETKGQIGVPPIIDQLLGAKQNGFFIECGAFDGEGLSNSLLFELQRNWTGLLIEPNYIAFNAMKQKYRKAHILNACLSGNGKSETLKFINAGYVGGLSKIPIISQSLTGMRNNEANKVVTRTACFPLYSILLALGNPTVDYFSLDVEGAEWPIMQSLPWDKVNISIISLENAHLGAENALLEAHMIKNGYEIKQKVEWDTIFVKKGVLT